MNYLLTDPNAWYDEIAERAKRALCDRIMTPADVRAWWHLAEDGEKPRKGRAKFAYKHFGDRVEDDMERSRR
jgi:hypothetical protein